MSTNARSILDLAKQLVASLDSDSSKSPAELDAAARRVASQVRTHAGAAMRKEWPEVRGTLKGLSRKARIRVEDDVASAYDRLVGKLEDHRRQGGTLWDENLPLQAPNIPQHVHLLLELAEPTNAKTQAFAEEYLVRPPPSAIKSDLRLYREIMSEPFEGDHWGPGYNEEVSEGWTDSSDGSVTPSEDEIVTPAAKTSRQSTAQIAREAETARRAEEEQRILLAKLRLRDLAAGAYWQTGGSELPSSSGLHGWCSLSSIPALASPGLQTRKGRAISSSDLQRELLFALSGRPGIFFTFAPEGTVSIIPGHADVAAFTPTALEGILATFAKSATQAARLRKLVAETLSPNLAAARSETCEAFAGACQTVLHDLASWVAEREASFMGMAKDETISTPLVLEREFSHRFGDILASLCDLLPLTSSPIALLNALYEATCSPVDWAIRSALVAVFVQTAAPIWRMTGDWLVAGMPVPESLSSQEADLALQDEDGERPVAPEFYIQRDRDSAWVDEDFWEAGFVVGAEGWPVWLESVRADILEGGKARGLLHSLPTQEGDAISWLPLDELITPETDVGQAACDFVAPICGQSQRILAKVLEFECGLQEHLAAIDGLSLMRGFDIADTWADWLFGQMAAGKPWADFHLLTHSLRDTMETLGAGWMNPACVRARTMRRARADLTDIRVDYLVPFPLSQVFTGTAMDLRSDVFTFLLRLLRARKLLLRARTVAELQAGGRMDVLVPLRRLRHAANWALDTLWMWINAVIDIQIQRHRKEVEGVSFHALVLLELEHGRRLCTLCFLHASTDTALQHFTSILDAAEQLFAVASTTLGVSLPLPRGRRRSAADADSDVSDSDNGFGSGSEDEGDRDSEGTVRGDDPARLEHIASSLGAHVRGLRDCVEALAGREGDPGVREMWGMLVFALQDWKDVL